MLNVDSLVSVTVGSDSTSFISRLRLEVIPVDNSTKGFISGDSLGNIISSSDKIRAIKVI